MIAMVRLKALPGTPHYKQDEGLEVIVKNAHKDLTALQNAGVDAVMFGNENDRPYEFTVDAASTATMAYVIGSLKERLKYHLALMFCGIRWQQLLLLPQLEQLLSVKYSPAPMHQIWGFGLQMQGKHLGIRNDLG